MVPFDPAQRNLLFMVKLPSSATRSVSDRLDIGRNMTGEPAVMSSDTRDPLLKSDTCKEKVFSKWMKLHNHSDWIISYNHGQINFSDLKSFIVYLRFHSDLTAT